MPRPGGRTRGRAKPAARTPATRATSSWFWPPCLAALVLPLSFAGAAVAIPAIGRELGGSPVALNWIVNAFMLSFGSCLMAAGTLADRFGRKRIFATGIGLFAVMSLGVALAPDVIWLDIFRAGQGIAAAAALAGGSAALAQEFDGQARTRAFSMLGTTFGVGLAFGPILAGLVIESLGWRAIFLSGTLIGGLSLIFGVPRMRETRDPQARSLDWPGTISFTGTLVLFTFGVLQAPESGWDSPLVVALLIGSVLLFAAFILVENRIARPMLDLSLFRYPRFVGVQILPLATCFCYVVLLVVLPIRFIGIEGHSEIEAGLMMVSLSAPMLAVPFVSAVLTRWISAGLLSGVGLLLAAAGLIWLSRVEPGTASLGTVAGPLLLIGFGSGIPWGLMDGLAVSVVPKERAGMATGIFGTIRLAGEGIALAIAGAILAALTQASLRDQLAGAVSPHVAEAAQRVATGDLPRALTLLPEAGQAVLVHSYGEASRLLLYILAAMTVLSALAVFWFLGRREVR